MECSECTEVASKMSAMQSPWGEWRHVPQASAPPNPPPHARSQGPLPTTGPATGTGGRVVVDPQGGQVTERPEGLTASTSPPPTPDNSWGDGRAAPRILGAHVEQRGVLRRLQP